MEKQNKTKQENKVEDKATEKHQKRPKQEIVSHVSNTNKSVRGRGRFFEGTVTKKFVNRVVIEAERTVYHHKYERYFKKKMRLHSRLPVGMDVNIGDYIKVQECRPLSKIIHSIVVSVIRKAQTVEVKNSETSK